MVRRNLLLTTLTALLATLAATVCLALAAPAATAHTEVAATDPVADSAIDVLPERVVITVRNKQVTRAGDAIRVFGPDGTRIDANDARVTDDGYKISVSILPDADVTGPVTVFYKVTSADQHVRENMFSFTVGEAAVAGPEGPAGAGSIGPKGWRVIGPPAASVLSAAVLLLALIALSVMIRRKRRRNRVPQRQPARQSPFRVVHTGEHAFDAAMQPPPGRYAGRPAGGMPHGGSRVRDVS